MKEVLSLQCPYKVTLDTSRNSYQFITSGGASYEVLFSLSNEILTGTDLESADVYHVVVGKTSHGDGIRDMNISLTVDAIIDHFFLIKNRLFFYICDPTDGRHLARFRMFNMWHSKSQFKERFIKLDFQIHDADTIYYACFIFDKQNDLGVDKIVTALNEVRQVLQDAK
ncbi:MAG: DUF6169 family protein [Cyclobacteriaceae bacterium]